MIKNKISSELQLFDTNFNNFFAMTYSDIDIHIIYRILIARVERDTDNLDISNVIISICKSSATHDQLHVACCCLSCTRRTAAQLQAPAHPSLVSAPRLTRSTPENDRERPGSDASSDTESRDSRPALGHFDRVDSLGVVARGGYPRRRRRRARRVPKRRRQQPQHGHEQTPLEQMAKRFRIFLRKARELWQPVHALVDPFTARLGSGAPSWRRRRRVCRRPPSEQPERFECAVET